MQSKWNERISHPNAALFKLQRSIFSYSIYIQENGALELTFQTINKPLFCSVNRAFLRLPLPSKVKTVSTAKFVQQKTLFKVLPNMQACIGKHEEFAVPGAAYEFLVEYR